MSSRCRNDDRSWDSSPRWSASRSSSHTSQAVVVPIEVIRVRPRDVVHDHFSGLRVVRTVPPAPVAVVVGADVVDEARRVLGCAVPSLPSRAQHARRRFSPSSHGHPDVVASAVTPVGGYGRGIRVTAFVFGSMRQSARSSGVVAQMRRRPQRPSRRRRSGAPMCAEPEGRSSEGGLPRPRRDARPGRPPVPDPDDASVDQDRDGIRGEESMFCVVPFAACSRVTLPSGKLLIQRSPYPPDHASAPAARVRCRLPCTGVLGSTSDVAGRHVREPERTAPIGDSSEE